jgi:hypothetical protein
VVWLFVHLSFLNGYGNRATTLVRWLRWTVITSRVELVFSVSHTGGDLSAPSAVRAQLQPNPYPEYQPQQQNGA